MMMKRTRENPTPVEYTPAEIDRMRRVAARVFFEESKDDPDYPHTDWRGQYDEMVPGKTVSAYFLAFVYEANKNRWPEMDA